MVWPYQQQTGRPRDLPREEFGIDVRARIAWLLRISRMASDAGGTGTEFARRIGRHGFPESPSWLSRRETGQESIPPSLISAYELELGLPPGHLRAPSEALANSLGDASMWESTRGVRRAADRTSTLRELDQMAAKINSHTATGNDWLGFSELMIGPQGLVLPTVVLDEWALQLVHEMLRSLGGEYVCRHESLSRMMRDTVTRGSIARAVHEVVADPSAQGTNDAWTVLGEADDPAFHLQLVKDLAREEGIRRDGIALALMHPMGTDSLEPGITALLGRVLVGLAADGSPGASDTARLMASALPPPLRAAVLRTARAGQPATIAPPSGAADLQRGCVEAATSHSGLFDDPMLERLVGEAISSDHPERQHHSNLLLAVSPYRYVIAQVAVDAAASPRAQQGTRDSAGHLLSYLAGPGQRTQLVRMLHGTQPEQRAALRALAHGGGVPHDVSLVRHLEDSDLQSSAMYAAGMSGHPDLRLVQSAPRFGSQLRGQARWWLQHGSAIGGPTPTAA